MTTDKSSEGHSEERDAPPTAREAQQPMGPADGDDTWLSGEDAHDPQREEAAAMVDEESIAETIVCGPDPEAHLSGIRDFADAGFDHVYVHQVGPDQDGFIDFYEREVLGKAERLEVAA